MNTPPPLFDPRLRRSRLTRSEPRFHRADFLHRRAAADLADRVGGLKGTFRLALDLGARASLARDALAAISPPPAIGLLLEGGYAGARVAAEHSRLVLDAERLPIAAGRLDLIVSVLALHWANDLVGALAQARRSLRPGGALIAALFGGATLTELRQALIAAEVDLTGGAGPRVSPFLDAADAPGLMQRAGFSEPVVDVERLTIRYAHPLALLADLRAMGETNVLVERPRPPLGRAVLARVVEIYRERFSDADGRCRATFDIITLTGWSPAGGDATHSQSRSQATRGPSAGGIG